MKSLKLASALILFLSSQLFAQEDVKLSLGLTVISIEGYKEVIKPKFKLPKRKGLVIIDVYHAGPAANFVMKIGNIITEFNDLALESPEDLRKALDSMKAGDSAKVVGYNAKTFRGRVSWDRGKGQISPKPRREVVLGSLEAIVDTVDGTAIMKRRDAPVASFGGSFFEPYIYQDKNKKSWLRVKIQCSGSEFIGLKEITMTSKGISHTIESFQSSIENSNGTSCEWTSLEVTPDILTFIKNVIDTRKGNIRFNGRTYRRDFELDATEAYDIGKIYEAYEYLRPEQQTKQTLEEKLKIPTKKK